jgi:hypothetical protein
MNTRTGPARAGALAILSLALGACGAVQTGQGKAPEIRVTPNDRFATPEQTIGAFDRETPWETCMTLGPMARARARDRA